MPKHILGYMTFDDRKNAYATTLEYEDGSEQTFDIPTLRGRKNIMEGMRPMSNKDKLMYYGED